MALFDHTAERMARGPTLALAAEPPGAVADLMHRYDPAVQARGDHFVFRNGVLLYGPIEITPKLAAKAGLPAEATTAYRASILPPAKRQRRPEDVTRQDAERLVRGLAEEGFEATGVATGGELLERTGMTRRAEEPLRVGSDRPSALTTPAVTDPARPSGLPTATTSWPTTSSSASPSSAGGGVAEPARITARSESGSTPTTANAALVPSANSAVPPCARPMT